MNKNLESAIAVMEKVFSEYAAMTTDPLFIVLSSILSIALLLFFWSVHYMFAY